MCLPRYNNHLSDKSLSVYFVYLNISKQKTYTTATDKDNVFEDQSNRQYLLQFKVNSANESLRQTGDGALRESEDAINELQRNE